MSEGPPFFLLFAPVWLEVSPLTDDGDVEREETERHCCSRDWESTRHREEEAICRWISLLSSFHPIQPFWGRCPKRRFTIDRTTSERAYKATHTT